VLGGFTLTAPNSEAVPAMMAEGARRIDAIFAQALADGRLSRDPSLNLPPPPVQEPVQTLPPPPKPVNAVNAYQVQVIGNDVTVYNFAMAHLRTLAGVDSATPEQINPTGTSYVLVAYHGSIAQLAAALSARGWVVDFSGTVVRIHPAGNRPPPLPAPQPTQTPPVQPPPTQPPPGPPAAATQNSAIIR
jgi:hypothetical protein